MSPLPVALRQLYWMRVRGLARALVRFVRTVRGVAMTLFTLVFLALTLGPSVALVAHTDGPPAWGAEVVQSTMPLGLLALWVVNLLTPSGQAVLYFAPAEIDFLFPAPFTRKELLRYKFIGFVTGAALLGAAVAVGVATLVHSWLAAWVGLMLAFLFLNGLTLCGELAAHVASSQRFTAGRAALAVAVALLVIAGLGQAWWEAEGRTWSELAEDFPRSTAGRALLAPLLVFAKIVSASAFGEAAGWTALALAMVLATYSLALVLDANYLEASVAVSRRFQERLKRMVRGEVFEQARAQVVRGSGLVALPWLGGLGPVGSLQLALLKRATRAMVMFAMLAGGLGLVLAFAARGQQATAVPYLAVGILAYTTFLISTHLPLAFRGDLRQIELLKGLPVRSLSIVGGQLGIVASAVTLLHGCVLAALAVLYPGRSGFLAFAFFFSIPFNLLILSVENLLFLVFPSSTPVGGTAGASHAGRMMVMVSIKFLSASIVLGVATGIGVIVLLAGGGLWAALVAAWSVLFLAAAAAAMAAARVFARLDVSLDVLE